MEALTKSLQELTRNDRYLPLVRDFSEELHDIFETILTEALIENPKEPLDGAAILAICMKCFKAISKTNPETQTQVPQMRGLPSQRYAKSNSSRTDNDH